MNTAWIIPFAQKEMVITFVEGVDPDFKELLAGYLSQVFTDYPTTIVETLNMKSVKKKNEVLSALQDQSKKTLDNLMNDLKQFQNHYYVQRIVKAVEFLPKDELAAMAESLVNLTSFKRKVSLETETVGGPIDVAVISKADGFIWIKRKHYFDEKYNHHFFRNYYSDCEDGD